MFFFSFLYRFLFLSFNFEFFFFKMCRFSDINSSHNQSLTESWQKLKVRGLNWQNWKLEDWNGKWSVLHFCLYIIMNHWNAIKKKRCNGFVTFFLEKCWSILLLKYCFYKFIKWYAGKSNNVMREFCVITVSIFVKIWYGERMLIYL